MERLPAQVLAAPLAASPDVGSVPASGEQAVPPPDGDLDKSSLFFNLKTLRHNARAWESSTNMPLPFSTANSLSGVSLLTFSTPNHLSTLNSLNYSSTSHNPLPQNEVHKT